MTFYVNYSRIALSFITLILYLGGALIMLSSYSNLPSLKDLLFVETASNSCIIGSRDKEIEQIIKIFSKRQYRNVLIYGTSGIGKKSFVEKIVYTFSSDNFCELYGDYRFLKLNVSKLVAKSKREICSFFEALSNEMSTKPNYVLIIDDIDYLIKKDIIRHELKHFIQNGHCVLAILDLDTIPSFEATSGIYEFFETVHLYSPLTYEVYDIIKFQIQDLEKFYKVTISEETAKYLIYASKVICSNNCEPRRSLNVLDSIMAACKLLKKTSVEKADLFNYFSSEYDKFNNLPEADKKRTAIHEVGHLLLYMFSDELRDFVPIAIGIIPSKENLGLTCFDYPPDKLTTYTEAYFIQVTAALLAGKIAEELFCIPANTGQSEDLVRANEFVINASSLFSLDPKIGDKILSEHMLSASDGEMLESMMNYSNEIMEKAREYATKVIYDNMDLAQHLVEELLAKGILVKSEIDEFFEKQD